MIQNNKKNYKKNYTKGIKEEGKTNTNQQKNKFENIQDNSPENKKLALISLVIISICAFIIYGNSLFNKYALDDAIVITENKFTQEGIKGIPDILKYDTFTGFWYANDTTKSPQQIQEEKKLVPGGRYRPLSLITFAIENSIFGSKMQDEVSQKTFIGCPFVNHLVNLLLYIATVYLLFNILYILLPKNGKKWYIGLPFLISLLFLFHPIHTEAIANIKGRDEIMTLLFSLLALVFTIKYHKEDKKKFLIFSGISLFLGLLSKENAITFLAVIPLTIYLFVDKNFKKIFISLLPLIISAAVFLIIRASVIGFSHSGKVVEELMNNPFLGASFGEKYATIFVTLLLYIKLLIFPYPLTYDYYPHQIEIVNFSSPLAILSLLLYLAMFVIAIYGILKKKDNFTWKIILLSIIFFLIPLSIVSNIFFNVGTFMNERFVFISSIGHCIISAYLLYIIPTKITKTYKTSQAIIITFLAIILLLWCYQTINRNFAWKDDYTLFTTDVKTSSKSAKSNCSAGGKSLEKAFLLRDNTIEHNKLCENAIKYLSKAVKIHPKYTDAWLLLGNAYYEYNYDIPNALLNYGHYLEVNNNTESQAITNIKIVANASNGLLNDKKTKADYNEIIKACDKILKINPNISELLYLKAVVYGKYLQDIKSSILLFEELDQRNNFEKTSYYYKDIGVAYGIAGDLNNALKYFLLAVETDKEDSDSYFYVATTYNNLGDKNNAQIYTNIGNQLKAKQAK